MEQGPLERFRSMAARQARLGSTQCELAWTVPKRLCAQLPPPPGLQHPQLACNTVRACLDRPKALRGHQVKVLLLQHLLQWHKHSCGLQGAIHHRDGVVGQRPAAKGQPRACGRCGKVLVSAGASRGWGLGCGLGSLPGHTLSKTRLNTRRLLESTSRLF